MNADGPSWKDAADKLTIDVRFDGVCYSPADSVTATVTLHNPTSETLYLVHKLSNDLYLRFEDDQGSKVPVRGHTIYSISPMILANRKKLIPLPPASYYRERVSIPLEPFLFPAAGRYNCRLEFDGPVTGGGVDVPRRFWDVTVANASSHSEDFFIDAASAPDTD